MSRSSSNRRNMNMKENHRSDNDDGANDTTEDADVYLLSPVGTANTMTESWDMEDCRTMNHHPNDTSIDTNMAYAEQYNVDGFCDNNNNNNTKMVHDDTSSSSCASPPSSATALPCWKRRNYQCACCLIFIVAALATTAGFVVVRSMDSWVFGRNDKNNNNINNDAATKDAMDNQQGDTNNNNNNNNNTGLDTSKEDDRTTPVTTNTTTTSTTTTTTTTTNTSSITIPTPSTTAPTFMPTASATTAITTPPTVSPVTMSPTTMAPITTTPTTFAPSSSLPTVSEEEPIPELFGFYFMGDIPYAPWEEVVLQEQLTNISQYPDLYYNPNTQFLIHIGDMQKPDRTQCALSRYTQMRNMFLNSQLPIPVLAMPGDNDWIDCTDPTQSLQYFRSELTHLAEDFDWNQTTTTTSTTTAMSTSNNSSNTTTTTTTTASSSIPLVQRMNISYHPDYPEVFSFSKYGVLFASVHLINSKAKDDADEWTARMTMNYEWIQQQVQSFYMTNDNKNDNTTTTNTTTNTTSYAPPIVMRAMVLFGHSQLSPDILEFFSAIAPLFRDDPIRQFMPVYYFHGDGHHFNISDVRVSSQLNWNTFHDIQVDQGAYCDPLVVEIMTGTTIRTTTTTTTNSSSTTNMLNNNMLQAEHENQHVLGGILRVDRRRGRYNDPSNTK